MYRRTSARNAARRPYKRPSTSKRKRLTTSLRNKPVNITSVMSPRTGVYGFPTSFRTKLRYHEAIALSSVSGSVSSNVFRANSCFDPNQTGTGHQPMYYDQLTAVYNRYSVNYSKIRVSFHVITETAATSDFIVGITGNQSGALGSDPNVICEQPHGTYSVCNGRNGSTGTRILTLDFTPQSCMGMSPQDSDVSASAGGNPNDVYLFTVWAADRQSTGTTSIVAEVDIFYDVVFAQQVANAGS